MEFPYMSINFLFISHVQQTLTTIYTKILGVLNQMPEDAGYRKHTSKIIAERMAIVKDEPTVEGIEKRINNGVVEEIIIQAENELVLARRMLQWKAWEPLGDRTPPENQWKWPI